MMRTIFTALTLALLVSAVVAAQSTLTGKWQGLTPNGAYLLLDLTVKGETLTGTLTRGEETVPIADGKVVKNTFSFRATFGDQAETISGELAGDEVKAWLDRQGRENAVTLKRVKQ
jgi:hypothetical protein